jgi:hypothetical protein
MQGGSRGFSSEEGEGDVELEDDEVGEVGVGGAEGQGPITIDLPAAAGLAGFGQHPGGAQALALRGQVAASKAQQLGHRSRLAFAPLKAHQG